MPLSPSLTPKPPRAGRLLRTAQRAWRLLHVDSSLALTLADQALARALERRDAPAEAWARLPRGFHLLYFARPNVAASELRAAKRAFDAFDHRVGHILARTGLARVLWRQGRYDEALKGTACGLTSQSSGRPQARCACLRPPLISSVRQQGVNGQ